MFSLSHTLQRSATSLDNVGTWVMHEFCMRMICRCNSEFGVCRTSWNDGAAGASLPAALSGNWCSIVWKRLSVQVGSEMLKPLQLQQMTHNLSLDWESVASICESCHAHLEVADCSCNAIGTAMFWGMGCGSFPLLHAILCESEFRLVLLHHHNFVFHHFLGTHRTMEEQVGRTWMLFVSSDGWVGDIEKCERRR